MISGILHGLGRGFNPTFGRNPSNALDENYCNAPARLLWRVVWALNGDYAIENVTELKSTVDRIVRREKANTPQKPSPCPRLRLATLNLITEAGKSGCPAY